jgi:hypothetical protein
MSKERKAVAAPILAAVAVAAVTLLGSYVGSYLWLGEYRDIPPPPAMLNKPKSNIIREYEYGWLAAVFQPAAKAESWYRGAEVKVRCRPYRQRGGVI